MRKKVLFLTWEFPPRSMSPISNYCQDLTTKLSDGMDMIVVTFDDWRAHKSGFSVEKDGLFVFYVDNPVEHTPSPLLWSMTLASEMERVSADAVHELKGGIELIHANDWITLPSAIALKRAFNVPLVVTLHSIEPTRVAGSDPYVEAIKKVEWQGTFDADAVIVNNLWMKYKVINYYSVPDEKIFVCPPNANGWHKDIAKVYKGVKT
jgi:hypothetical protein